MVVAVAAEDAVVAGSAQDQVIAGTTVQSVVAIATVQAVVAGQGSDDVVAAIATGLAEQVIAPGEVRSHWRLGRRTAQRDAKRSFHPALDDDGRPGGEMPDNQRGAAVTGYPVDPECFIGR